MREYHRDITDFLRSVGASDIHIEKRKHAYLTWTYQGKAFQYHLCFTPSDWRSGMNAISDLRRMMGLTKTIKVVGKRRKRKQKAAKQPIRVPTITALPEEPWRAKLRQLWID